MDQKCSTFLPHLNEKSQVQSFSKSLLGTVNLKQGFNFFPYSGVEVYRKGSFILLTSEFSRQDYLISVEKSNSYLTDYNVEFYNFDYKRFNFNQYVGRLIDQYNQFSLTKILANETDSYRFVFNVQLLKPITFTKINVDLKKKYSDPGHFNLILSTNSSEIEIKNIQVFEGITLK